VVPYRTTTPTGKPAVPWWKRSAASPAALALHTKSPAQRLNADGTVALASASAQTQPHDGSAVSGWPALAGIAAIGVLALGTGWQLRRRKAGAR
jgi:hypothetical protein